jgi:two-component system sensor histidine kinase QseC
MIALRGPGSLQGRLLLLVLGLVTSVWIATAVMTWIDVREELDALLDGHLAQAAALLVVQQGHELESEELEVDEPSLRRYSPKVAFQVFHEGRLALRSSNAPEAPMIALDGHFQSGFMTVRIDGIAWRVFAAFGAERDAQVYVAERIDSRAAILWAALRSGLWPTLAALPLLALGVWWAVRHGIKPLRRLRQVLRERQAQALDPLVLEDAPQEMKPLVDALNDLFGRIVALMEAERRFTADAAHELRTPIAAIRAQAQVALGEHDDALRRHALQATLIGCDRANRLVGQMLTLSRIETGAAVALMALDLVALVRQVVAELGHRAILKQQSIGVDATGSCVVQGDATLLGVLVRNLVDNAIRYSPEEAVVNVTVDRQAGGVRLTVEDSGPGMNPADRAQIGQRFFRVLGSGEEGSGLGWSIVQRIAAVHHARIRVADGQSLGGLRVEVEWPAQD